MKSQGAITVNGRLYPKGSEIPWFVIYPFFMFHMLAFGGSGFFLAYADESAPLSFLYLHGGIAISVYLIFYLAIFGADEVKWMFLNAALGLFGIYTQIGWILSLFGKQIADYPLSRHVIPFLYFVLYTFLLRHAFIDLLASRDDDRKKESAEYGYIVLSLAFYAACYYFEKR